MADIFIYERYLSDPIHVILPIMNCVNNYIRDNCQYAKDATIDITWLVESIIPLVEDKDIFINNADTFICDILEFNILSHDGCVNNGIVTGLCYK